MASWSTFSWWTAAEIFVAYTLIDLLYGAYIISVNRRQPVRAACLTSVIYSLLAFGVLNYSKNPMYLVPLATGAFIGTFITVKFHPEKKA